MLTTDGALDRLRELAAAEGFDERRPALQALWPAVKAWVGLPIEGVEADREQDLLLFECSLDLKEAGKYSFGPSFIVAFTRQFSHYDDAGEYLGMEHVTAELRYAVHDDFRAIARMAEWSDTFGTADQFWGVGGPAAADWAARVEASKSYLTALRHEPIAAALDQSPV